MVDYGEVMQSTRHPRNWKTDRQGMWQPRSNTPVQESRGRISAAEQGSNRGARTRRSKAVPGDSLSTGRIQEDLTERTSALSLDPGHHLDDSNAFTARRMARTATTSNVATTSSDPESLTPPRYSPNPSSRALTVGIGSGLGEIGDYQRHHHRLLEPNDEYEEQFIEQKKREPFDSLNADHRPWSRDPRDMQTRPISALQHDDLCFSSGPQRVNEERGKWNLCVEPPLGFWINWLTAAVCASINGLDPQGHWCHKCQRPPGYFESFAP